MTSFFASNNLRRRDELPSYDEATRLLPSESMPVTPSRRSSAPSRSTTPSFARRLLSPYRIKRPKTAEPSACFTARSPPRSPPRSSRTQYGRLHAPSFEQYQSLHQLPSSHRLDVRNDVTLASPPWLDELPDAFPKGWTDPALSPQDRHRAGTPIPISRPSSTPVLIRPSTSPPYPVTFSEVQHISSPSQETLRKIGMLKDPCFVLRASDLAMCQRQQHLWP